jgi:hypothetical protein
MKKIAIFIVILGMTLSYSCKKDKLSTTIISGQLRTNGTEDVILMNTEIDRPTVDIYHAFYSGGDALGGGSKYEIIHTETVDANGRFSITLDLLESDDYFIGYSNLDTSRYYETSYTFYSIDKDAYNHINIGTNNSINLYLRAKSFVRPRFINTNPNPNNGDMFYYTEGPGPISTDILLTDVGNIQQFFPIKGAVDTLAPWIHKTWSGKYAHGYNTDVLEFIHHVEGKLTRNGVTIDTNIFYSVPPFDTTIVEIRY